MPRTFSQTTRYDEDPMKAFQGAASLVGTFGSAIAQSKQAKVNEGQLALQKTIAGFSLYEGAIKSGETSLAESALVTNFNFTPEQAKANVGRRFQAEQVGDDKRILAEQNMGNILNMQFRDTIDGELRDITNEEANVLTVTTAIAAKIPVTAWGDMYKALHGEEGFRVVKDVLTQSYERRMEQFAPMLEAGPPTPELYENIQAVSIEHGITMAGLYMAANGIDITSDFGEENRERMAYVTAKEKKKDGAKLSKYEETVWKERQEAEKMKGLDIKEKEAGIGLKQAQTVKALADAQTKPPKPKGLAADSMDSLLKKKSSVLGQMDDKDNIVALLAKWSGIEPEEVSEEAIDERKKTLQIRADRIQEEIDSREVKATPSPPKNDENLIKKTKDDKTYIYNKKTTKWSVE